MVNIVYYLQFLSLGDHTSNNIIKVVYAEELNNGSGFLYLADESDNTVYPEGSTVCSI